MSFLRCGERLKNGSRSGVYVYGDGKYINIHISINSQKRRKCEDHVKITYGELIALANACNIRGWTNQGKKK